MVLDQHSHQLLLRCRQHQLAEHAVVEHDVRDVAHRRGVELLVLERENQDDRRTQRQVLLHQVAVDLLLRDRRHADGKVAVEAVVGLSVDHHAGFDLHRGQRGEGREGGQGETMLTRRGQYAIVFVTPLWNL